MPNNGGQTFIVLNQDKLKQDYKIVPYQWNYSIGSDYIKDHKKEREEFVITDYVDDFYHDVSFGSIKPLSKYIIGFYVSDYVISVEKDELVKLISEFEDLYLGHYRDNERNAIKNYMTFQGDDITNIKNQLKNI